MKEKIEKYAAEKQQAEKKIYIGLGIIAVGVILFLVAGEYGPMVGIPVGIIGIIFGAIGFAGFSKLSHNFKKEVVTELVETYVDNGVFNPQNGLAQHQVYATEFIKHADRFHTEDYLSGSMDGVDFVSSDVVLEERHVRHTKNGTETYYETYFKGRVFIFDFNKPFEGYLQVLESGRPISRRKFKKVKLESVAFNKKFKTFCTSEHSAFYVLTPHFMEALMNFEKNNKGDIRFSFIDNYLYIGINNFRDTFTLNLFKKLDESTFDEFKRELLVIKEVITELKLNKNIFKKGV